MKVSDGFSFRTGKRPPGFTLLETLVALSVLAIALVVILQLFSGGLKAEKASDDYTRAVFYGREKMEEILLVSPLEEGVMEGDCDERYRWQTAVTPIELPEEEAETLPFRMMEITVRISWNQGVRDKRFELHTTKILEKAPAAS
jgi:general secretion pathway protein I